MMKMLCFIAACLFGTFCAHAQAVSLRDYCPDKLRQEGGTCASYAPVYTALSTQYNAAHNYKLPDTNFTAFSYGFVASKIKAGKNILIRLFTKCGWGVQANLALDVLKETGTVRQEQFPYPCSCARQKKVQASIPRFKIKGYQQLGDVHTPYDSHLNAIKEALNAKCPVIIPIYQTVFFRQNKTKDAVFPADYEKEVSEGANHVVCILGYDDARNGGSFLVKNNYLDWGNDHGFAYVRYDDLFKLIRFSYRMVI